MIRLAALQNNAFDWGQVAARLRGATIENASKPAQSVDTDAVLLLDTDAVLLLDTSLDVAEKAAAWLSAAKHVLLAGDLCTSSEVLANLSAAAKASGAQLWCVNPDRFIPSRYVIREQLDKGHLGDVGLIRSHRWIARPSPKAAGTIELPPLLTRDLDLALWYAGHVPNRAYAVSRPVEADRSRGDIMNIHLGFEGGAMALLDYARRLPPGAGYQSLSVIGSTGAAYADDHQNMQLAFAAENVAPRAVQTDEGIRPLVALVQAFVDGLAGRRDFSTSVNEWQTVLKVRDGVQRSIATGQAISWEGN